MYITQGQFNTIAFYQMYFKRFKYLGIFSESPSAAFPRMRWKFQWQLLTVEVVQKEAPICGRASIWNSDVTDVPEL